MNPLGKYYTENTFSSLLVKEITIPNPKTVLDLGIGAGSLTSAAYLKWNKAKFLAADIDHKQIKQTTQSLPFVNIIQASGLHKNIHEKLKINVGSVDVAICNPPYLKIQGKQSFFTELFEGVSLRNCNKLRFLTSDLIFLAQNLRLLKQGGELGIILPDGLLTSHEFNLFRRDLITNHSIKSIIQLPDKIFKGTEARTHILIIQKGCQQENLLSNLYLADINGKLKESIKVQSDRLIERMDFTYHQTINTGKNYYNIKTLGELGAEIQRGQLTHAELKVGRKKFVHTTSLEHCKPLKFEQHSKRSLPKKAYARGKDILLARVGRGCIGKVSLVTEGERLISDCIYRISVPEYYVEKVWKAITSSKGQEWLKASSHGVCARVVSKTDLLNFPVKL